MKFLLFIGLVCLPTLAAFAQTKLGVSCTLKSGECVVITAGQSTDQSVTLPRGKLYYAVFDPDTNTTGTAACEVRIYGPCVTSPAGLNTCEKLIVASSNLGGFNDRNLDGGDATDGSQDRVLWNLAGGLYFVDIITAPATGENALLSFEVQLQ